MVPGAVWYATGYLYSLYTAAEHSISAFWVFFCPPWTGGPWRLAAAADEQIERLSVVLQAVSRCSWFTSCLGLSDMPLPTPTAHLQPQSTRFSAVDQLVASCPPWTAAPKRLSQWSGRQGTGTS